MSLWVFITITAAFLQNIRSTLQKYLKGRIGTLGATFVRFGYGLPFALFFLGVLHFGFGSSIPALNSTFLIWVVIAALSQIAAQALLIHLFSYRNFAVGTAYSRTEPVQAALFGLLFLSETISPMTVVAIAITVFGVMIISVARTEMKLKQLAASVFARSTMIGLCSGSFFGLSAVGYRGASTALEGPNFIMQSAVTLCIAIAFQTVLMLLVIIIRNPGELRDIARAWKPALSVGFVGATASFGWFAAMTLEKAAVVKALAQVEMLFTFASTVFIFRERINAMEILGCIAIVCGILALLFA